MAVARSPFLRFSCVVRLGRRSSTAAAGEATSCSVLDIDRYKTTLHFCCTFPFSTHFPAPLHPSISFFFESETESRPPVPPDPRQAGEREAIITRLLHERTTSIFHRPVEVL